MSAVCDFEHFDGSQPLIQQTLQHLLRYLEMIAVYEFNVSDSYSIPPHPIHELSESFSIVETGGEGLIVQ